jgi:hypothetical protein
MGVAHASERTPAHRPASKPNRVGSSSGPKRSRACRLTRVERRDAGRTRRQRRPPVRGGGRGRFRRRPRPQRRAPPGVPVKPPVECSDECVKLLRHLVMGLTRRFSTREPVGMDEANSPLYESGDDKRDHCRYPHGCTARGRGRNQEHLVGFDQHETIPARRSSPLSREGAVAAPGNAVARWEVCESEDPCSGAE